MTTDTINALEHELRALTATIDDHRADVTLFERLKLASVNLKKAEADLTALTAKLNEARAEAERQAKATFIASYRDFQVTRTDNGEGLPRYRISYSAQGFDSRAGETRWHPLAFTGFEALNGGAMRYLLEFAPEKLPTFIADLAPGDPHEAMERYLNALRRGYLSA